MKGGLNITASGKSKANFDIYKLTSSLDKHQHYTVSRSMLKFAL